MGKCKSLKDSQIEFAESIEADSKYVEGIRDEYGADGGKEEFAGFFGALTDTINGIITGTVKANSPAEQWHIRMETIDRMADSYFSNKDDKEKASIITKLMALSAEDPGMKAAIDNQLQENILSLPYEDLSRRGTPVKFHEGTGKPILATLPLPELRNIMRWVQNDLQPDGPNYGRLGNALYLQFSLSKTALGRIPSKAVIKFKKTIADWRNRLNGEVNTYLSGIDVSEDEDNLLVHPETGVKQINVLKRSKAGINQVMTSLREEMAQGLMNNGQNMISEPDEVFIILRDLMSGKAFFRQDGDHFGEVWMYEREAPVGTYENGDYIFSWVGKKFNMKKEKEYGTSNYVSPYITSTGKHLKFQLKYKNGPMAEHMDSITQHIDRILLEFGENTVAQLDMAQKRWNALNITQEGDKFVVNGKEINIPGSMVGELSQLIETDVGDVKGTMERLDEEGRPVTTEKRNQLLRLKEKISPERNDLVDKDGNKMKTKHYKRYSPILYFNHRIPVIIEEVLNNLNAEIELLQEGADFRSGNSLKDRRANTDRLMEYRKYRDDIQAQMDKNLGLLEDAPYESDDEPKVFAPFEKHFKKVTHLVPYEERRADSGVYQEYFRRVSTNIIRMNMMMDAIDGLVSIDSPIMQEYIWNKYKVAFGQSDAHGRMGGFRFSTQDLAKVLPYVNADQLKKILTNIKQWQVFATLSGPLTGAMNLAAMISKIHEVGVDSWHDAFITSQKPESAERILRSGVLSFQDIIENHLMIHATEQEILSYRETVNEIREKVAKYKNENDPEAIAQMDRILSRVKQTKKITWLRSLATWSIKGEFLKLPHIDRGPTQFIKKIANLKRYISIDWSEKIIRSVSFQIGAKQSVRAGAATSMDDPVAIEWGKRYMDLTDYHLGAENMGDWFGNDAMQLLNHVRIWSNQRFAYGKDSVRDALRSASVPIQDPKNFAEKMVNSSSRGYEFTKALFKVGMPFGLMGAGVVGGAAVALPLGTLAGIAGGVGGLYGGYKFQDMFKGMERVKAMRIGNQKMAKGAQMFMFHGFMSALYDLVIFNFDADWGSMAGLVTAIKRAGWKTGAHKAGPSFAPPEMRLALASISLLLKWKDDEEEIDGYDYAKLMGSYWGIGSMFIGYLILNILYKPNRMMKNAYKKDEDFERKATQLYSPPWIPPEYVMEAKTKVKSEINYLINELTKADNPHKIGDFR